MGVRGAEAPRYLTIPLFLLALAAAPSTLDQSAAPFNPALLAAIEWAPLGTAGAHAPVRDLVTDQAFPYRVCGTRADGRATCVTSRPDAGLGSISDWAAIALDGPVAPDPLDQHLVYGGRLHRLGRRTGQAQWVGPPAVPDATTAAPLAFLAREPRTLLFAAGPGIWKSVNAGQIWTALAPRAGDAPVVSLAPSYVDSRVIWAGMGDGAVLVTRDAGATWAGAGVPAPPNGLRSIEASHFDPNTSYIAVAAPADDARPSVVRTRDGGRTWSPASTGLPSPVAVHVVREDAQRRGLLFAGTDRGVFVSFDDGESWQGLRLNMPDAPVTDLVMRDADLVAATPAHGVWLLRDAAPLRQLTGDVARARAFVFRPAPAWRLRSPLAGADLYYLLGADAGAPVALEIVDPVSGTLIQRLPDAAVRATAGLHRVAWDLRHGAGGPLALPGTYQIHLSVAGQSYRQAVVVRVDPRVRASAADLAAQFALSKRVFDTRARAEAALAAPAEGVDRAALADVRARLGDLFARLQSADARPSPVLEAEAEAAVARALALIGDGPRPAAGPRR